MDINTQKTFDNYKTNYYNKYDKDIDKVLPYLESLSNAGVFISGITKGNYTKWNWKDNSKTITKTFYKLRLMKKKNVYELSRKEFIQSVIFALPFDSILNINLGFTQQSVTVIIEE